MNSTIDVILRDVNDKPRDIKLSNNKVTENATINTLIGQFSARDEDAGQNLLFSLADDDNGRFRVDSLGKLYKANSTNYETQKKHRITAVVTDNGKPTMKVCQKPITMSVLLVLELTLIRLAILRFIVRHVVFVYEKVNLWIYDVGRNIAI